MTLNTTVYVHDYMDPRVVFFWARDLLGATEEHGYSLPDERGREIWEHEVIHGTPGAGLDALLYVHYRADGDLVPEGTPSDYPDEDPPVPCHLRVEFDTGYAYQGPYGEGCGGLHARLLLELGGQLDAIGRHWSWVNEFTGERWGPGPERYEHLGDLGEMGEESRRWLIGTVLPAIGCESNHLLEDPP